MDRTLRARFVGNTAVTFLGNAVFFGISIVLTPYLLSRLGVAIYGVWVSISAVTTYLCLVTCGLDAAVQKLIAEAVSRGEDDGATHALYAGLALYLLATPLVLSLGLLLEPLATADVTGGLRHDASSAYRLALASLVLRNFMLLSFASINGHQRMRLSGGITLGVSLLYAAGVVVLVSRGYGIRGVALAQLLRDGSGMALAAVPLRALHALGRPVRARLRATIATCLRFSFDVQVKGAAELTSLQLDKILIARLIDPATVAIYDVGARLALLARTLPMLLLGALAPTAAAIDATSGRAATYRLFERVARVVGLVAFPLFATVFVVATPTMALWVGPDYVAAVPVTRVLCIGFLASSVVAPVLPVVEGIGRTDVQRNGALVGLAANIVFSSVLVVLFGAVGAAAGTTLALLVGSAYFLVSLHRHFERPVASFLRDAIARPGASATLAVLVALLAFPRQVEEAPARSLEAAALTALFAALVGAMFLTAAWALGAFRLADLRALRSSSARPPRAPRA